MGTDKQVEAIVNEELSKAILEGLTQIRRRLDLSRLPLAVNGDLDGELKEAEKQYFELVTRLIQQNHP